MEIVTRRNIFISYSRDDSDQAKQLYQHLAEFRHMHTEESVFFDQQRIKAGEEWSKAIQDAMEQADVFILLVSKNFLNSEYCLKTEAAEALCRKDSALAEVFLVLLADCKYQSIIPDSQKGGTKLGDIQFAGPICHSDGRLQALEKVPNKDEAWVSIVDKLYAHYGLNRSSGDVAQNIIAEPALLTVSDQREKLLQLAYRLDRNLQCEEMESLLRKAPSLQRPFLVVAHGCEDDKPRQFIERVAQDVIPRFLQQTGILVAPLVATGQLPSRPVADESEIVARYGEVFFKSANCQAACPSALMGKLSERPGPKLFHRQLIAKHPQEAAEYFRQVRTFLAALPDCPPQQPLFVLLVFKHSARMSAEYHQHLISHASAPEQNVCALPPFEPLDARDIDDWINDWAEPLSSVLPNRLGALKEDLLIGHEDAVNSGGLGQVMAKVIQRLEYHSGQADLII